MVGITALGAYVPLFRLDKRAIGDRGEKAICSFDEDSVTMAVEAVSDCLKGRDRSTVDALYYGTTTSLYKEHLDAATIAMAADLQDNVYTAEMGNSLRAGTMALKAALDAVKAGSARAAVAVAADCRLGTPGSGLEQNFGDGAAAVMIGDGEVGAAVGATIEGSYSVYNEIMDVWRTDGDRYVRTWEDRFVAEQGYLPSMRQAIVGLMERFNYKPADFARVVLYSPDSRRGAEVARRLGFDPSVLQDPMIGQVGNTGSASALMLLVAALEEAKAGDLILLASYGNGADAFAIRATENIDRIRSQALGMKGHLSSKRIVADYLKYLRWRGIVPLDKPAAAPIAAYSAVAAKREYDRTIRLRGSRCKACEYVQFPAQRVCTHCHTKDQMEPYSFTGQTGKVFSYTLDYISPLVELPIATVEIDFDAGGRIQCYMTEVDVEKMEIGMPAQMTFRRHRLWEEIPLRDGVYTYFWQSKPLRS